MERTGHRSLEGVRSYKRMSENQKEVLSDILYNKVTATNTTSNSEDHKHDQTTGIVTTTQQIETCADLNPAVSSTIS